MKTIYGHWIIKEKGEDLVLFKDYQKLLKIIENQQEAMEDTIKFIKCLYTGGYISEMTKNNIIERIENGYKEVE